MTPNPRAALAVITLMLAAGCASTPKVDPWPQVGALPQAAPSDLAKDAQASVLRAGSDGFLYLVGGLAEGAAPGDVFAARYSGQWPMGDLPRPPLAVGQILRVLDADTAIVDVLYQLPGAELESLEVTWDYDPARESVGKGFGQVVVEEGMEAGDVTLSVTEGVGVTAGDVYAVVRRPAEGASGNALQLGRRLAGVCMVREVTTERAVCRMWRSSGAHPLERAADTGDLAILLEHTYGAPPRPATFQVAAFQNDPNSKVRDWFVDQVNLYLRTHAAAKASVGKLDLELDPRSPTFHRAERLIPHKELPQIAIGGAVVEVDGAPHLFINYTGVGAASGPGMIAAPPTGGVDLGPVDAISTAQLRDALGVLYGGLLVYRGQTSEALSHLRQVLSSPTLAGPMRWHARDQYAMRWAALGHLDEALWIVLEDEKIATEAADAEAILNALGTRVRLYDMLGLPERAVEASERYLDAREASGADLANVVGARGMHAEMLFGAGRAPEAKAAVAKMFNECPKGCEGDLYSFLSGVYWSIPEDEAPYRDEILGEMTTLAKADPEGSAMASLRIYEGLSAMRARSYEQSLLAFMDAERLFEERHSLPGVARAKYFSFLAKLAMKDPIQAYDTASEVLEIARELRDYGTAKSIYDRLASVYLELDASGPPGPYARTANAVLTAVFESQLSTGDMGKAAETAYVIGTFYFRLGRGDEADIVLVRAIVYSVLTARFEIAAMSHLARAMLFRARGDAEGFRTERDRALLMAKLSGDPAVAEQILRALAPAPREEPPEDLDTQPF
jgi:tetratricopeptide (TPR) repeat protein